MCGIAGIISLQPSFIFKERLQRMSDALAHRGPDGEDQWICERGTAGFGHRRLAILDLSSNAAQPMHYMDRYTIVYNGEIYNYIELRDTLIAKGYAFRSSGDTEVILAAYACFGKDCLQYLDGMFAFAIWDNREQLLFAARDRFGEKPFFFYDDGHQFLFASEMKALWAAGIAKEADNTMLLNYITTGTVTNPLNAAATFYTNISKLPAAHYLQLQVKGHTYEHQTSAYWHLNKQEGTTLSNDHCTNRFKELLTASVKQRLRSDVSLGTSLSGGLDSSSIVAILHSLLPEGTSPATFSAVFPGFEKDESKHIKEVTGKFGLTSYTVTPSADDFAESIKKICYHQEEPFQSSSIYAQYKVYELAKQQDTIILLDGQGADEVLAGYYKYYPWYWQQLIKNGKWAGALKEIRAAKKMGIPVNWGVRNYISSFMPEFTAKQLKKRVSILQKHHPAIHPDFYVQHHNKATIYKPVVRKLNDLLYFNTMQGGLEELLRYADRNSMAHSREIRLPFLQHDLVQFVFSLPAEYKIRQGFTKWILRRAMEQELPVSIVWRKDKTGFEPPQHQWMQQDSWQEYFRETKRTLVNKGILKPAALDQQAVPESAHGSRNYDWRYLIAGIMFE